MRTELRKPFRHGFILTEQELRRIHDIMVGQMEHNRSDEFNSVFELRYKNGIRAQKASLEEIISENNSGEEEIQELKMTLVKKSRIHEAQIEIEFRVPPPPPSREATQRPYSIQYYVLGEERDWVYLTSSKLDDRIAIIKQLPIFDYTIFIIAGGIVLLFFSLLALRPPPSLPLGYKVVGFFVSASLIIGGFAGMYGFHPYNFCWGDHTKIFNNRRNVAKFIINGVIIALVLSVVGSVIGSLVFIK